MLELQEIFPSMVLTLTQLTVKREREREKTFLLKEKTKKKAGGNINYKGLILMYAYL